MKIIQITSQFRRDFYADIECEGCGNKEKLEGGYDDRYYHDEVMPKMKCKTCGKSRTELGVTTEHIETRYPEGMQV